MRKRIRLDQLGTELEKTFKKFDEDLRLENINVMRRVCSNGAAAVRDSSASVITPRYARGWGYKTEQDRFQVRGWIYHQQAPGLPHLLEHGHAMPQGGRVAGRPHIAPVADELEQKFVDETIRGIGEVSVKS